MLVEEKWTRSCLFTCCLELSMQTKDEGDFGIMNLSVQNEALLLKHAKKFLNKVDIPWVHLIWNTYYHNTVPQGTTLCGSFWWKDICKKLDNYRAVTYIQPNRGDTFLFWSDSWAVGDSTLPLAIRYQRLFSFLIDTFCTAEEVFEAHQAGTLINMFHLPLSDRAHQELDSVTSLLQNLDNDPTCKDSWLWNSDGKSYTAKNTIFMCSCPLFPTHSLDGYGKFVAQ